MTKIQYVLILIAMCFSAPAFTQDGESVTVRDLETWSAFSVDYKVNKKLKFGLEQQMRLYDNTSNLDVYLVELSSKFDLSQYLYGGIGLRYARQLDKVGDVQGFENHFRVNFDLGVEHEIKRFNLEYRLRFQSKNELGISKDEGDYASKHLRLKVGLEYNIKKWKLDPEFSTEIFRHYQKDEINGFNKFRLTVGTKYNTKSFGKFGVFYRMERELNAIFPQTTNIIGFNYTYTLKKK